MFITKEITITNDGKGGGRQKSSVYLRDVPKNPHVVFSDTWYRIRVAVGRGFFRHREHLSGR